MNRSAIVLILFAILIISTYINRSVKMNRLRNKMNNLQTNRNHHEVLIMDNDKAKNTPIANAFNHVYPCYIAYINACYANMGVPGSRGDQWLYKVAKLKGSDSFFIVTFFVYMSRFFPGSHEQKTNDEFEIFLEYKKELEIIYNIIGHLREEIT